MFWEEILQSEILQRTATFSFIDIVLVIGAAFLLGIFIYLVYQKTFTGVMYSRPFNISLVLLTMVTSVVILAVTSDILIALGMVGALSIVRFRTPIKDPMDLVFLFWAIATGIILGAGFIILAVIGSIVVGIVLVGFVSKQVVDNPYMVMVNCAGEDSENNVVDLMKKYFPYYRLKSKTISPERGSEIVFEVRMKDGETNFLNELSSIQGVSNAYLVSFSGEYAT